VGAEEWISLASVVATLAAVITALVIATVDRRAADRRAAEDRAEARREARLRHELEQLARLTELLNRGGSTDPLERQRMGSEVLALLVALDGERRLPVSWATHVKGDLDVARAYLQREEPPDWRSGANEALLELHRVARMYHEDIDRRPVL